MATKSKSTKTSAKQKFTEGDIKKNIQKMKEAAEAHRKSIKDVENFVVLDEEEMRKKLQRVNSPIINSMGWSPIARGATGNIGLGIFNPDPGAHHFLFVHMWVGPGNPISDNTQFLLNVDARFPRLTLPTSSTGITLAPGTFQNLTFAFKVPSTVEASGYMCNFLLIRHSFFDVGTVFDRSGLVLNVT
jgi:hypothetical protein